MLFLPTEKRKCFPQFYCWQYSMIKFWILTNWFLCSFLWQLSSRLFTADCFQVKVTNLTTTADGFYVKVMTLIRVDSCLEHIPFGRRKTKSMSIGELFAYVLKRQTSKEWKYFLSVSWRFFFLLPLIMLKKCWKKKKKREKNVEKEKQRCKVLLVTTTFIQTRPKPHSAIKIPWGPPKKIFFFVFLWHDNYMKKVHPKLDLIFFSCGSRHCGLEKGGIVMGWEGGRIFCCSID